MTLTTSSTSHLYTEGLDNYQDLLHKIVHHLFQHSSLWHQLLGLYLLYSHYYCNTETEKNLRTNSGKEISCHHNHTQRGSFLNQISSLSTLPPRSIRVKKTKIKATNSFCNIFSGSLTLSYFARTIED